MGLTLALDLRNGYLSLGLKADEAWILRKRHGLVPMRTRDDWAIVFSAALREAGMEGAKASRAAFSSVVPSASRPVREALEDVFGVEALSVGPGVKTGIKIRTDQPSELGADLVCMAVAANALFPRDLVLIDSSGAALTFSALNAKGEFLGAAFVPGIEAAAASLRSHAAQIPQIDLSSPPRAIGKNTAGALAAGILNGYRGLMDGIVADMEREMGSEVLLIGSGQEEKPPVSPSRGFHHYDPWLCLEGLAILCQRNA